MNPRALWVAVLGLSMVALLQSSTHTVDACPAVETTMANGQHYRLEGVCVTVENDQVDALLDEDWRLSIWTGNQFIPVVAVIDELSWLDSSAVQLSFLTLSEDVQIRLSGSAGNS